MQHLPCDLSLQFPWHSPRRGAVLPDSDTVKMLCRAASDLREGERSDVPADPESRAPVITADKPQTGQPVHLSLLCMFGLFCLKEIYFQGWMLLLGDTMNPSHLQFRCSAATCGYSSD